MKYPSSATSEVRSLKPADPRRKRMWVLMITVLAVTSPPNRNFQPSIVFQEYTSEKTCADAKEWLERGFGSEIAVLNKLLVDHANSGDVREYEKVIFSAVCTLK
jgi:hypothetical protein